MSYRIMKTSEYKTDLFYRASCMCGSEECDLTLELEYDEELNEIILYIYKNVYWSDGWSNSLFVRFWKRLKASLKIMFTGNLKMDSDFIFDSKEQIKEFTSQLESGITKISEIKRLDSAKNSKT